jgi:hypothetical protein
MAWVLSPDAAAANVAIRRLPYEAGGNWNPANCVLAPLPHTAALAALIRATFPWSVARIGGTRCKAMQNRRTGAWEMDIHSVGRALDVGVPVNAGAEGEQLANWLVSNGDRLGLQLVIWNRSVWQPTYPQPLARLRFQPYTGTKPHEDHVHVEVYSEPGPMLTANLGIAGVPFPPEPLRPQPPPTPATSSSNVGKVLAAAAGVGLIIVAGSRRRRRR